MKALLFTLIFTSICLMGFKDYSKNTLTIGSKEWVLDSAIIANESYGVKSKFEVDLISGSGRKDLKATTLIWFSVTSNTTFRLAPGIYHFSSNNLNERLPFQFNSTIRINNHEIKITSGTFSIGNVNGNINVDFILELANGDIARGNYYGQASAINRSRVYE